MKIKEELIRRLLQDKQVMFKEVNGNDKDIKKIFELDTCLHGHEDSGKVIFWKNGHVTYKCHHDSCKKDNIVTFLQQYDPELLKKMNQKNQKPKKEGDEITEEQIEELMSAVQNATDIKREPINWLLPNYIPLDEITVLAAAGGSGKGFLAAEIIAGLTNGKMPEFMRSDVPFKMGKIKVLYLTSEDSSSKVLEARWKAAGVNLEQVEVLDRGQPILQDVKIDSQHLDVLIDRIKPDLVVLDPLQSFLPDRVRMESRNQMRNCLNNLTVLAEKHQVSFLIFCHLNKRDNAYEARKALADSSDIWDIARSVMFTAPTHDGDLMYFSLEKHNYTTRQNTILYRIESYEDSAKIVYAGTTEKRFYEFRKEEQTAANTGRPAKASEDAKKCVIDTLKAAEEHTLPTKELDEICLNIGISKSTLGRVKTELKNCRTLEMFQKGNGKDKVWYTKLNMLHGTVIELDEVKE